MPVVSAPLPFHLLPDNATVGDRGQLVIGGCDTLELAAEFGTPLFVYDEDHLRARARDAVAAFGDHRPTRSAIAVAALPVGARVEIEAWAYVGDK